MSEHPTIEDKAKFMAGLRDDYARRARNRVFTGRWKSGETARVQVLLDSIARDYADWAADQSIPEAPHG